MELKSNMIFAFDDVKALVLKLDNVCMCTNIKIYSRYDKTKRYVGPILKDLTD